MSQIANIILLVRSRLNALSIKLWEHPYYCEGVGAVEAEMDRIADDFSKNLGISLSNCKFALTELQDGALRKLEARKEFAETGLATFSVRRVSSKQGTQKIFDVKCHLTSLASVLQKNIAEKLELGDPRQVKIIARGKIIDPSKTLESQNVTNNQQFMVILSEIEEGAQSTSKVAMYDRIRKTRMDVEALVDSKQQYFQMEDQEGNAVFLPPAENRALLIGLGLYEKARAAMKRENFDEALVLLLEADEQFSTCNSNFLDTVDNYALVNLDIVWCYLCLKNVTQLPDAQRRLNICEKSFNRSYGENMSRLIALKGSSCPERALIMRLHLLQGVVLYHQNRRDEAYHKLETAQHELEVLKVDESLVIALVEMGYDDVEARLALRSTGGVLEQAINFIHEKREKIAEARHRSSKERRVNRQMAQQNDIDWVNPRSVCTLMEMGFENVLVVAALKQTKNDVTKALDMLQNQHNELLQSLPPVVVPDMVVMEQLTALGFPENLVSIALQSTDNRLQNAIDFLLQFHNKEEDLIAIMDRITEAVNASVAAAGASSAALNHMASMHQLRDEMMQKAKAELETLKAFRRFGDDISHNDEDYLDLPLNQEEQLLAEYKTLLEQ